MAMGIVLMFQDASTRLVERLIFFHDHVLLVLLLILTFVLYLALVLMMNSLTARFQAGGNEIEIIWTILPAVVLIFVAFPSLRLLYLLDEVGLPGLSLKVVGHQWYWSYEYSDFNDFGFDSYMMSDTTGSEFRLLDVDNRTIIPLGCVVRALISSGDVIHSWAVPALGMKMDAFPGRINQVSFCVDRVGLFFGQCSEICGANHSFMPVVIECLTAEGFVLGVVG